MASSILRQLALFLYMQGTDGWDLIVSTGQCDPTGLDDDKVVRYAAGAMDSCSKIKLPEIDLDIGVKIGCTDSGMKFTIFEDKTCEESSMLRHAYMGKSGSCMLLTGAGHYASLVWNEADCKEGPAIQTSETCQAKSHELAASEPEYTSDLYDCQEYHCPEIKNFNGVIDYGALQSDCTCTVGYKNKQAAMEQCQALPGGAKTCFVSYKVENRNGGRLHIGNGMADCIPESCLGSEDQAALAEQWTLSCLDIPGVSTCAATVSCHDPPPRTTAAPEETPAPAATADAADRTPQSWFVILSTTILLLYSH
eukprot:gnl/MRDRNA2_/MRDRNA2_104509_c0_seq1.p1 gnl/MRDRNA2_/MRDRNA2_104509_c0~~gnl/MRDRNA2_/MRDRNA2_104509_c0_seq1.p1  ORF type:complete len:339 (-),score=60.79 gnl/MRDRNA2_/MRDRNA2_104509_c0_seq1:22-948(-)